MVFVGGPRQGEGIVFGTINDISFGGSDLVANGTDIGDDRTRIFAKISDIPPDVGKLSKIPHTFADELVSVSSKDHLLPKYVLYCYIVVKPVKNIVAKTLF